MTPLEKGDILTEEEFVEEYEQYGDEFTAEMGGRRL